MTKWLSSTLRMDCASRPYAARLSSPEPLQPTAAICSGTEPDRPLWQATLTSTGFDVHQDIEDYDFIEYTVVVKLTADLPGEPPSRMRVVGAPHHFQYGAAAGSAGGDGGAHPAASEGMEATKCSLRRPRAQPAAGAAFALCHCVHKKKN